MTQKAEEEFCSVCDEPLSHCECPEEECEHWETDENDVCFDCGEQI